MSKDYIGESIIELWKRLWKILSISSGATLIFLFFFWILCLNHISYGEVGVYYDSRDGRIWYQDKPGWYRTSPLVKEVSISTLPLELQVPTGGVIKAMKVVRLKPSKIEELVKLQGFSYGLNNLGSILPGYVFSDMKYDFYEVIQETTTVQKAQ